MSEEHTHPDDEAEETVDAWRKEGRCSSCVYFESDYGADPDFYGHCKMYPRTGSRECSDWACGEYGPLKGFSRLTKSTSRELDIALAKEKARKNPPAQPGIRRRVMDNSSSQPSPAVVRRTPVNRMPSMADLQAQRREATGSPSAARAPVASGASPPSAAPRAPQGAAGGASMDPEALREVMLDVLQSVLCVEEIDLGTRWHDGSLILEPADPDQKPTVIPIESFWNKIVMVRDRLRVLEQKINSHEVLTSAEKVDMQQYISRCYGSLTTFNILFQNRQDRFSSK